MLALIDPALLEVRPEWEVAEELGQVLHLCRHHHVTVPSNLSYWDPLWADLGARMERQLQPGGQAQRALRELRKLGRPVAGLPATPQHRVLVWGFTPQARGGLFSGDWPERMAEAAVRTALTQQRVILLVRRVPGRNLIVHRHAAITLDEITRWKLYVRPPTLGPVAIDCCSHPRHLEVPWTIRMDWRLPDQGRYPYCAPQRWKSAQTPVFVTSKSRPAWVDALGNEWARPNIQGGAGYHWDVYVNANQESRLGLGQLNVVAFGGPPSESAPGSIHHMKAAKRAHFKDRGWTCP